MKRTIAGLISISLLGGLIGSGLRYGLNVVVARGLGTEAFGAFTFGMVVMKIVGVTSIAGLNDAAQKFVPEYEKNNTKNRLTGLTLFCIGGSLFLGIVLSGATYIFIDYFISTSNQEIVRLFLMGSPLFAVMMVGISLSKGFRETRYAVLIREIIQSGVALALVAAGSLLIIDLTSAVIGYLFSLLIGCLLIIYFLFKQGAIDIVWPKVNMREIVMFAVPTAIISIIQYIIPWASILFLGILLNDLAVGKYQSAYQTAALLPIVLHAANSLFPSLVSDLESRNEKQKTQQVYTLVTKWVTVFTLLGFIFVVINSNELLNIFEASSPTTRSILIILAIGQLITAATGPVGFLIMMTGYERLDTINVIFFGILSLVSNYILIQPYGPLGAAIATTGIVSLLNITRLVEIWHILGYQPYSVSYIRTGIAIPFSVLIMWLGSLIQMNPLVSLSISGLLSITVFIIITTIVGISSEDRMLFNNLKR